MSYNVKEAKNNFSTMIRLAEKGQPQIIKRHHKDVAVLISIDDWKSSNGKKGKKSLLDAIRACPIDLSELELNRQQDLPRDFDFED